MLYQAKVYGETFCYYKNYSRGHQIPSADRTATDELNSQTFYASNITPQNGDFNGGIWASLEGKIRENMCQDTLYVVTGCYFGNGYTLLKSVPYLPTILKWYCALVPGTREKPSVNVAPTS